MSADLVIEWTGSIVFIAFTAVVLVGSVHLIVSMIKDLRK